MLPLDMARCVGRRDLSVMSDTCPHRTRCARYVELFATHEDGSPVNVSMWGCPGPDFGAFIPIGEKVAV